MKPTKTALDIIRKYGNNSLAYHMLQPDNKFFIHNHVLISYQQRGDHCFVLGQPLGEKSALFSAIDEFMKINRRITFVQTDEITATYLDQLGYNINCFGLETALHLPFNINGADKADIRVLCNSAKNNKIRIEEIKNRRILFDQNLKPIIGYQNKKQPFSFLARPFIYDAEEDVRIFGAFVDDALVAFSLFDPIYSDGIIIGFAESIIQRQANSPKGSRTLVLIEAMKQFHNEKIQRIELGISPFHKNEEIDLNSPFEHSRFTTSLFKLLYNYGDRVHNFKGLSFYKSRFRGVERPVYFASRHKLPVIDLLKIFKLTTGNFSPF